MASGIRLGVDTGFERWREANSLPYKITIWHNLNS